MSTSAPYVGLDYFGEEDVFSAWQGDAKAELIAALEAAARPLLRGSGQRRS